MHPFCCGDQSTQFHSVKIGSSSWQNLPLWSHQITGTFHKFVFEKCSSEKSSSAPFGIGTSEDFWWLTAHVFIKLKKKVKKLGNFAKNTRYQKDRKQLHYCCSSDLMQAGFYCTHKVANFPCSTGVPAAYVGVESHFAVIIADLNKVTLGAEQKNECEDFMSPCAKSVTLIAKPVN